jgi:ring-1,2-phenylacetyl-CoA epoxidase subunit PaaB
LDLPERLDDFESPPELDQWPTWQVFHQEKRGEQHRHVGIVHAPSAELALVMAKEQYARRGKCVNLWVVLTTDVYTTEYTDADLFEPATNKNYRDMNGYRETRKKIREWLDANNRSEIESPPDLTTDDPDALHGHGGTPQPATPPPAEKPASKPRIIIGRKS